jgi:hypothetical protein
MPTLTHDEIVAREHAVHEKCLQDRQDPVYWIAQDRAKRWSEFRAEFPVREEVAAWAESMAAKHGTVLRFYNNTVDWVAALLICRYGEAEYNWPVEFSDADVSRAKEWIKGKMPDGVLYLS